MAEMFLHPQWNIRLSGKELLLVLKALGGRKMLEHEVAEAQELCDKLTLIRAAETTDLAQKMQEHAQNVKS